MQKQNSIWSEKKIQAMRIIFDFHNINTIFGWAVLKT